MFFFPVTLEGHYKLQKTRLRNAETFFKELSTKILYVFWNSQVIEYQDWR